MEVEQRLDEGLHERLEKRLEQWVDERLDKRGEILIEYCARLKAGKFDLDRVLRLMDIVFLLKEVVIKMDLMCADEVMITKGKQKASDGGEQRRHSASLLNKDLVQKSSTYTE